MTLSTNILKKIKILTNRVIITKFGKSELKTRFVLTQNFGLKFKLSTEFFGSSKD